MSISATARRGTSVARISVPVALGLTVLAAGAVHAVLALRLPAPWIVPDEIRYSELAKSLGNGQLPAIRGVDTFGFGLGYPLLIAPAWALFEDVSTAYTAAKVLNAFVLALTAVPAYLLARRFVDERASLVAAVLTVSIPSLLYAGTLMTEVALYPTFTLAVFAVARALDRPSSSAQLLALGAIALASTVKVLALTLLPGYVVAILLFSWLDTRERPAWTARIRRYWSTWVALATVAVVGAGLGGVTGRSPTVVLGTYGTFISSVDVLALPQWMFFHIAAFDFFIAVIPFAATALAITEGLRRNADRDVRLFAVLALTASTPLFAAVAAYSSTAGSSPFGYATGAGANERATFALAPLGFIGLVLWLRDRPGSRRAVILIALGAGLLPAAIPLDRFDDNVIRVQALSLIPWVEAAHVTRGAAGIRVAGFVLAAVFAALVVIRARDVAFVVPVAAVFVATTMVAQTLIQISSEWTRLAGIGSPRAWIDRAGAGERASVLWYEPPGSASAPLAGRHRIVWLNEFYNRNVDEVYELGSPMPYGVDLPTTPVRLSSERVVLEDGRPAPLGPLVLAPCFVRVEGERVASDPVTKAALYRVGSPVRVSVSAPDSQASGC